MQVTQAMLNTEAKYRALLFEYLPPLYSARTALSGFWGPLLLERGSDARKFAAKVLRHARHMENEQKQWESRGARP